MKPFRLQEFDGINHTPAIPLIARGWLEMLTQGTAAPELPASWDQKAIVALKDDVGIAVMTYTYESWRRLVWIHFGYVAPEYRRRGAYRMMWERLVVIATKLGAAQIQGGVHVKNQAMQQTAYKLGRTDLYMGNVFVIEPAGAKGKVKK